MACVDVRRAEAAGQAAAQAAREESEPGEAETPYLALGRLAFRRADYRVATVQAVVPGVPPSAADEVQKELGAAVRG
jgi:hypothetical protein